MSEDIREREEEREREGGGSKCVCAHDFSGDIVGNLDFAT
jgi:hypothetical protein